MIFSNVLLRQCQEEVEFIGIIKQRKNEKEIKKKSKAKTFKKLKCSPVSNSKGKKYTCYTSEAL